MGEWGRNMQGYLKYFLSLIVMINISAASAKDWWILSTDKDRDIISFIDADSIIRGEDGYLRYWQKTISRLPTVSGATDIELKSAVDCKVRSTKSEQVTAFGPHGDLLGHQSDYSRAWEIASLDSIGMRAIDFACSEKKDWPRRWKRLGDVNIHLEANNWRSMR